MSNRHMRRALERIQLRYPVPNPELEPPELEEVPELALPDINPYQALAALDYENEEPSSPSDPESESDPEVDAPPELDHESDSESQAAADASTDSDIESIDEPQPGPSGEMFDEPQPGPSGEMFDEPQPGPSGEMFDEPQPGPSGEMFDEPQPGPSGEVFDEPQPGPSGELFYEPQPGPSGVLFDEPQPGPSGELFYEPQPGPSRKLINEPQPGPSGVLFYEPQPGPSRKLIDEPQPGPSRKLNDEPQPGPSGESQAGHSSVSQSGLRVDLTPKPEPGSSGDSDAKSDSDLEADRPVDPEPRPANRKPSRRSRRRANRRQRLRDEMEANARIREQRRASIPKDEDERSDDLTDRLSPSTHSIFSTDNGSPEPFDDVPVANKFPSGESESSFTVESNESSGAEYVCITPDPYRNGLLEVEDTDESMSIPSLASNQRDSYYSPTPPSSIESFTKSYDDAFEVWQVNEVEADALLSIKAHIMRVTPETRRLFGSDVPVNKRRKKTPRERILRKSIIIEYPEDLLRPYNHSLTMSSCKGPNNTVIYMFDHTPEHQKLHREFLDMVRLGSSKLLLNLDAAQENIHIESMIEIFDAMCRDNNFGGAHHLIQVIVAMLQYATKPSFNLSDRHCRLPYRYIENRPFHIVMLKYMYLLSNKARHRTALEMCKMMFNLDPSDPLALLFVIDTFALRARDFRWLVDVLEFWSYDRNANLMFNMLFSHSLAFYHLVRKSDDDADQRFAGELLQNAIIRFPYVITAIISNIASPAFRELKESEFYGHYARASTSASMIKLIDVYARLTWPRWYEPVVVNWFLHNAQVMANLYIVDAEIQASAQFYASYRARMFVGLPEEVVRHMCILQPISNWVLDGIEVPVVSSFDGFDPLPPPDEIDRYGYKTRPPSPVPAPTDWVDWLEEGEVLNIDFDDIEEGSYDYTYTQTVVVRHRHRGRGLANRGPFPSGSTADEGRRGRGRRLTRRFNEVPRVRHFQNHFR